MVFSFDAKEATIMADEEKKGTDADNGGGSEMTLAEMTAMLKSLAPQIAELQKAFAAMNAPAAAEVKTEVVDGDTDPATPPVAADSELVETVKTGMDSLTKIAAAMDGFSMVRIMGAIKERDALAAQLQPHIGAFDHAAMDVAGVAAYGCEKLGLKPTAGQERAAIDGYLVAAAKLAEQTVTHRGLGMDAAPRADFVSAYLNGTKE